MIIEVNDDYRITSDEHCWMVQRIKRFGQDSKKAGEVEWRPVSFHPSLPMAARSLSDRLWRVSEPGEGESLTQTIERLSGVVRAAVTASEAWGK
jgi:hypothetical protein